ncbi:MAG: hypothetical protein P1P82_13350 [Bacteroidales bacterium]|nr:hypothetical protein [Bacteroidales bacterium]MDT8433070.1 hypothetical protein [Bacteroidales bacterium]
MQQEVVHASIEQAEADFRETILITADEFNLQKQFSCSDKTKYDQFDIDLSQYESIVDLHQYSDSLKIMKLATTQKSLITNVNILKNSILT